MAILVTGGAGYIGSVVVDDLLADDQTVVVLDNLSRGRRSSVNDAAAFYEGDVGDVDLVRSICSSHEVSSAMHFASFANVGESVEHPDLYYRNNVVETVRLLDALRESGVMKFILSSTCATYGEPVRIPIDESHPQVPTNPYGRSKLMIEQMLADSDRAFGMKFVSLRYFNACGATARRSERHEPETHLIPLVLDAADGKTEFVPVYGNDYPTPDGTAIRDYIHVSDLSSAHLLANRYLEAGGSSDAFNLGNGTGFSVLEVIDAVRCVAGRDVPYRVEQRRPGDPSHLIAKSDKVARVLGWKPERVKLETIIGEAWKLK